MIMKESINIIKTNNKFYNVYEVDAYIFNFLFGYKIMDNNKVGFPDSVYNKIINTLEDNTINYNVIFRDKDNIIKDFKNRNNYLKFKDRALDKIDVDNKVNMIIDKIKKCNKNDLEKIFYIIYEYFK